VRSAFQTELSKLLAQLATRLLILVCAIGPFAFAALLKIQSGTPSDALLGVWVHSSGFAVSVVVLEFAGNWGFPLIAGVLAGDVFASEDRNGTWKMVLTRSCTRWEVFGGKLLAAATLSSALLVLAAVSSLLAGIVLVGAHPLVDLSGSLISAGHALVLTALSWVVSLPALLAYTSVAALISIATRNGIVGVIGPVLLALVTQLLDLIGKGVWVHYLLIGADFDGWHGLFTAHVFIGPLLVSTAVCLLWSAACLTAAWRIMRDRDFVSASASAAPNWQTPLRVIATAIVVIAVLALATNLGPTGDTATRLRTTITPEFTRLTVLQQRELGHSIPAGAHFDVIPNCNRHGAKAIGPGDWTCTMDVYILEKSRLPQTETPVEYDVSVEYNGCFKAQSPPSFVGGQTIRDSRGHQITNPLFVVYGCFNIL
jgi:ABC-2 type transport system permease protein